MKVTASLFALLLSLASLGQSTEAPADSTAQPLRWNAKLELGAMLTNDSHGTIESAALQVDFPSYSLVGRVGRGNGENLLSKDALSFNQVSLELKKQTTGEDMKLFASVGVGYAWGDLNATSSQSTAEANQVSPASDEMICFPISAGFQLNLGSYVGLELGGYFAPSLSENHGGVRASFLLGRLK